MELLVEDQLGTGFRPYCDECGDKLWAEPLTLYRARWVGQAHANEHGHLVRIEPWGSYRLIEHRYPQEYEDPADADPYPAESTRSEPHREPNGEARG